MSLNFEEVNILGQILNDTFGQSSTGADRYKKDALGASVAVKPSLSGSTLSIMAIAIKNLGSHGQQHSEIAKCENELDQYIDKFVGNLRKEFKKQSGRALKCKQIKNSENTDIEIINHYAATRASYVRRRVSYELA